MSSRPNGIAAQKLLCHGPVIAVAAAMTISCGPFPPEPVVPVQPAAVQDQAAPEPSCGPAQPSTRESLVQWVSMTRESIPELTADIAAWIQMTQDSGKPGPVRDGTRPEKADVEPSAVFGMATIAIFPVVRDATTEDKAVASAEDFECNGLVVHSKINGRVFVKADSKTTEAGFINLDSGPDYLVIDGRVTLKTRVKVDFPGNAFWEPMSEDFILGDRVHLDMGISKGESCNVFVLGSEKKDELTPRVEPDRGVVPELVELMRSAPSRYTRGLAAIHLGIIRDGASVQAMLDAFAMEKNERTRADIALGLGILGDKSALGPIEEAAKAVTENGELAWKYREAVNRLKGRRH